MLFTSSEPEPRKADPESFWSGLLGLIRALVLGRRLPPDQLRTFLLFAPPVEVLSSAEIYELLHREENTRAELENYHGVDLDDWTLGYQFEFEDHRDADAHANVDFLTQLLRNEHPEWKEDWDDLFDDNGNGWLCWRVLDERGRVAPIAAWMAGKMKLLEEQRVFDEAYVAKAIRWMIEHFLSSLLSQIADLHTWRPHRSNDPGQYITEWWGAEYVEPFMALDVRGLPPDADTQLAQWMVDYGRFTLDWEGPDYTLEQFIEALKAKGWIATTERPAKTQKSFLA